jgi:spectinomycin phosphotransferase
MLDRPPVEDAALVRVLDTQWGLAGVEVSFLPIGNDARSWSYRVDRPDAGPPNGRWFLKLRAGPAYPAAIEVPGHLHRSGVPGMVPAKPTLDGRAWHDLAGFVLAVYPYLDGGRACDTALTDPQWTEYGSILRAVHDAELPADLRAQIRTDPFVPRGAGLVHQVGELVNRMAADRAAVAGPADPAQDELATLWRGRAGLIATLARRADELGTALARRHPTRVVCHADIHRANLLVTPDGHLAVVDWDEVMLAVPERDLTFVPGPGDPEPDGVTAFRRGYGRYAVDPVAYAYYLLERAVSDIGTNGESVFLLPGTPQTRQKAAAGFQDLFEPGNIVELSLAAADAVVDAVAN